MGVAQKDRGEKKEKEKDQKKKKFVFHLGGNWEPFQLYSDFGWGYD